MDVLQPPVIKQKNSSFEGRLSAQLQKYGIALSSLKQMPTEDRTKCTERPDRDNNGYRLLVQVCPVYVETGKHACKITLETGNWFPDAGIIEFLRDSVDCRNL